MSQALTPIPAFCGNCGLVFDSPIGGRNITRATFENVTVNCPRCQKQARILDGIYDSLGDTFRVLLTSNRSVEQLRSLRHALKTAREQKASPEEIRDAIKAHAPELQTLADTLPTNRAELYNFVMAVCAFLAIIIASYAALRDQGPTKDEVDAMIGKAICETMEASRKQSEVPQTQRPAPQAKPPMNRHQRRAQEKKARHK